MPTKPTNDPEVWASLTSYPAGPKAGQDTKSADAATLAQTGHIPGKDFPTAANEFNRHYRDVSDLATWAFDGSFDSDLDAHIIETNLNGKAFIASLELGGTIDSATVLTVKSNLGGLCMVVEPVSQTGITINSTFTAFLSGKEPLVINSPWTSIGVGSSMILCTSTAPSNSMGGILANVNTDNTYGLPGDNNRNVAAINGFNEDGAGGEFRSNTTTAGIAALHALNISDGGISCLIGHAEDELSTLNIGGTALDAKGGPANDGTVTIGGIGVIGRGGVAGAATQIAGIGVFAEGGDDPFDVGSDPALVVQNKSRFGRAMVVTHINPLSSQNLAEFVTGTNTAPGVVVVSDGFGNALKIESQGNAGIRVQMTPEVGGDVSCALELIPQLTPSVSFPIGGISFVQDLVQTSSRDFRCATVLGVQNTFQRTAQSMCYARSLLSANFVLPATTTTTINTFTIQAGFEPVDGTLVKLILWGSVLMPISSLGDVDFRIVDTTSGSVIIFDENFRALAGSPNRQKVSVTTSVQHVFTTGGARTFRFEAFNKGSDVLDFNGWVEIEQITGT